MRFAITYLVCMLLMTGYAYDQLKKGCEIGRLTEECGDELAGISIAAGMMWPLALSIDVFERLDIPLPKEGK